MPVLHETRRLILLLGSLIARLEARALALLIAAATSLWIFLSLAEEVTEGGTDGVDRWLLLALRNRTDPADPLGPAWLEEAVRDITALGGFTLLTFTVLVATLLLIFHDRRREALVFSSTVVLAQISSEATKALFDRERPVLAAYGSYVYSQSYPSGHSTMAAVTFFTLATVVASVEAKRRTKALIYGLAVVFVVLVGISRVYLVCIGRPTWWAAGRWARPGPWPHG